MIALNKEISIFTYIKNAKGNAVYYNMITSYKFTFSLRKIKRGRLFSAKVATKKI